MTGLLNVVPTKETRVYQEPEYHTAVPDWTPSLARLAWDEAQKGYLERAGDLCDALRSDARIRAVFQTRANGLLGTKLSFEALGDGRRSNQVIRTLDDDGEFWDMYPESALTQIFTWGLLLNVGLAQVVWERNMLRGGVWQQRLVPKHPRHLRWDFETRRWMLTVVGPSQYETQEIVIEPGDGNWVMWQPYGENTPWAHGLWWPLALEWLSKSYAKFDWDRRNEARGRSALIGTTPDGAGDEDRKTFAKQLALLRVQLGIALPSGYDVKAVEFGGDDHDTFEARIEGANAAFAILVLGQNLTTEVRNAGSYAAGRSQERVRQDYLEQDAETLSTALREQLLIFFAAVRFSDPMLAPYPKWETEPPENLANAANIIARASEALDRLLARNVPVDVEAYLKRFKIPIKAGAGAPITGPVAPTNPPGNDVSDDGDTADEKPAPKKEK